MTYITSIFAKRVEVYEKFTAALLEELETVTTAGASLLSADLAKRLVWKAVNLVDSTVTIVGIIEFPIGEKIIAESGLELEVTEEMQQLLNQVVRVSVPLEMAENATVEDIVAYLKALEAEHVKQSILINESTNTSHDTVADLAGEFRTTGLTKEQITSMILYAEQSKGKVN